MAETELVNEAGVSVFRGTQLPPGGGSQPLTAETAYPDTLALGPGGATAIDVAVGGLDPLGNGGTIDGVTLVDGTRVLLYAQGNSGGDDVTNGIWVAHAGPWTRPDDFSGTLQTPLQVYVFASITGPGSGDGVGAAYYNFVNGNDVNASTSSPIVVDTDPCSWFGMIDPGQFTRTPIPGGARTGLLTILNALVMATAVDDSSPLSPSQFTFWLDPTNGAAKLNITAKTIDGTVVRGQIALS